MNCLVYERSQRFKRIIIIATQVLGAQGDICLSNQQSKTQKILSFQIYIKHRKAAYPITL